MKNTKRMTILLILVMVAAVVLGAALLLRTNAIRARIAEVQQGIDISFAAWNKTASEKEALQADLKVINNDLKEADTTLTESLERAAELEADIAALQATEKELRAILAGQAGDK